MSQHLNLLRRLAATGPLALVLTLASPAHGHGIDAGRGEGQLRGSTLRLVLAPAAEYFPDLDTNADGTLSSAEVLAARDTLRARLAESFVVHAENERVPELTFFDVGVPTTRLPASASYVRFTFDLTWPTEPAALTLTTRWPLWIEIVRVVATSPGRWRAIGSAESLRLGVGDTSGPVLVRPAAPPATTFSAATATAAPVQGTWPGAFAGGLLVSAILTGTLSSLGSHPTPHGVE